jgi:KDO2-lipid IV(A) lauroyltransferase
MEKVKFTPALLHPRYWLTWLMFGSWWLVVLLPYPVQLLLARMLTLPMMKLAKSRRQIAEKNFELCFPELSEAERYKLLKENFFSTTMALFESGMAWFWPHWRLRRLFTIEGLEHLEAQSDKGVLMMAMHFTTLDIGGAFINMSASIDGMYRPHGNPVYDFVQRRGRERHNPGTSVVTRKDIRGMLKLLKKKRAVWYSPDQDYGRTNSVFVPLFGVQACTVTATATFARIGKAAVVPFVQTRLPGIKGYKVTIYPAFENYPEGDEYRDAERINEFVEARIREQPAQYLWAHRRFKNRPEGEKRFY